ncbi:MAG: helix-turn-helix domain-containing protein [Bacteroidales bacterium]|nr:helix-turn-helix domain-containing protein [Bacteroidales bacterium]
MTQEQYFKQKLLLDRVASKTILDTEEAAALMGVGAERMRDMARRRQVPHYRQNGHIYFRKAELEAWLTADRQPSLDEEVTKIETRRVLNRL